MKKKILFILLSLSFIACRHSATLDIEAAIIYNVGGPQPIARQNFYLLDANPMTINGNDDLKHQASLAKLSSNDDKTRLLTSAIIFSQILKELSLKQYPDDEKKLIGILEKEHEAWEPHLVKTLQTDFTGKARIDDIKPGNYWLMALTETRGGIAFWNLPLTLTASENKIKIDQNNAVYAK